MNQDQKQKTISDLLINLAMANNQGVLKNALTELRLNPDLVNQFCDAIGSIVRKPDHRVVKVHIDVYVPEYVVAGGEDSVEEYLNTKLHTDPDFYGEISTSCFTITDESEYGIDDDDDDNIDVEKLGRNLRIALRSIFS